jgi:DNA-binding CsgD family transcriptional regulator
MEQAAAHQSRSVVIEGEPGIGKSRLVNELISTADAQRWAIFLCRSSELDVDHPFLPVLNALDGLISELNERLNAPALPPELAIGADLLRESLSSWTQAGSSPELPANPLLPIPEGVERITTMIVEGLHELARTEPVLVVFEDAHWIDDASARLAWRIARARRNSGILTVLTTRQSSRPVLQSLRRSLDGQGSATVKLGPLNPVDALALATEIVGSEVEPDPHLLDDANGNPLFVTELMRGAVQLNAKSSDPSQSAIPESLKRLVLGRYFQLPAQTQNIIFDASLMGQQINISELCVVCGYTAGQVRESLIAAIENRMIVDDQQHLGFQHAIVQKIVAESRPALSQRERHGEIAALFAAVDAPPTRVAEHLWLCHPDPSPAALGPSAGWMRRAAETVTSFSLTSALGWTERALNCSVSATDRLDAQLELASLLVLTGRVPEAQSICAAIDTRNATNEQRLSFHVTQASIATKQGRSHYDTANQHLDHAMEAIDPTDSRMAELLGFRAVLSVFSGNLDQAYCEADEALSIPLAETKLDTPNSPNIRSSAYEAKGLVDLLRGNIRGAQRNTELATNGFSYERRLCTALTMPHFSRAFVLLSTDPIQHVISVLNAGYRTCDRAGHQLARTHLEPLTAVAHFLSGDLETASRIVDTALERERHWDRSGFPLTMIALRAYLSMLSGDIDEALALSDSTSHELTTRGSQGSTSDFAALCVSRVNEAAGRHDVARDVLILEWKNTAKRPNLLTTITPDLVRLTLDERPAFAAEVTAAAIERAGLSNTLMGRLNVLASRGQLERDPTLLDQAADIADQLGWQIQSLVFRSRAAEMLVDKPDRQLKERVLRLHKEWGALGAPHPVSTLEKTHERYFVGSTAPAKRAERVGFDRLTQAERTVVQLVAEGLSNREIAERLFVSHRTVESHVSHTLAKLQLTSRVQLANLIARAAS